MIIIYKDITIRNAEIKDCSRLAAWWNDGKVMAHAGFPNGLGTSANEIEKQIENDDDHSKRLLVIEYKGVLIGEMSFCVYDHAKYGLGIKICEAEYQNKGLGKIVLSMLIEELFNQGASLIILDTNLKNERAQHVYETLGFKKVAVNVDSWKDQLGELQSSVDYELVQSDFKNMKCWH